MKLLTIALLTFFGVCLSLPSFAVPQYTCTSPDNVSLSGFWASIPDFWAECSDGTASNGQSRWDFECNKRKNQCSVTVTFLSKKSIHKFARTKGTIGVNLHLQTAPTDGSASRDLDVAKSSVWVDTLGRGLKRHYVTFDFPYTRLGAHLKDESLRTEIKAILKIDPPTNKKTRWNGHWLEMYLDGFALEGNERNNTMTIVTIGLNAEVQE